MTSNGTIVWPCQVKKIYMTWFETCFKQTPSLGTGQVGVNNRLLVLIYCTKTWNLSVSSKFVQIFYSECLFPTCNIWCRADSLLVFVAITPRVANESRISAGVFWAVIGEQWRWQTFLPILQLHHEVIPWTVLKLPFPRHTGILLCAAHIIFHAICL